MLVYFQLVEMGYGTFAEVSELPAAVVLQALYYKKYRQDLERAFMELNKS